MRPASSTTGHVVGVEPVDAGRDEVLDPLHHVAGRRSPLSAAEHHARLERAVAAAEGLRLAHGDVHLRLSIPRILPIVRSSSPSSARR
jgi:hypothetical protein